jgi:hypothetical protein
VSAICERDEQAVQDVKDARAHELAVLEAQAELLRLQRGSSCEVQTERALDACLKGE